MEKLPIWRARKKILNLTNQNIADEANLPLRTVEQIMCGKVKNPRIDTVDAIERVLGLSPDFTEEELAQGVGNHAIVLSDEDSYRLNLLAEAETVLGIEYVRALLTAVEIAIQQKQTK